MSDWTCPACNGGFPDNDRLGECPWCGQAIDGSYESTPTIGNNSGTVTHTTGIPTERPDETTSLDLLTGGDS